MRTVRAWTTALAVLFFTSLASAAKPRPLIAGVKAPQLQGTAVAIYPEAGTGNATVVLHVTVDADGHVTDAEVHSGAAPFAEAARLSAMQFSFEPAEREGHRVSAKVAVEVRFRAPEKAVDGVRDSPEEAKGKEQASRSSENAADTTKPAPIALRQAPVLEVVVLGERSAPAVSSMSRSEVRQLPGAFGDPFRAIESMPGVTPLASGVPFFYVRGAPPGNIGYFLDGVRVPYLFHLAMGPSVIHPGMVNRVDLYPGGYPAHLGRYAGGIVHADVTKPNPITHGEANIRLFDAGAMTETGFAGGRGTLLLGGRYSYTGALLSLAVPDISLGYRDFQSRITYAPSSKNEVSLFSFGAYDLLQTEKNGKSRIIFGTEFYRSQLRYTHGFDRRTAISSDVTLGYDQSHIGAQRNGRSRMLEVRSTVNHVVRDGLKLRVGADTLVEWLDADGQPRVDRDDPQVQAYERLFRYRTDLAFGVWSDAAWQVSNRVEIIPGVRLDVYRSGATTVLAIEPRLAARFRVSDRVRIHHAYGVAHQPPAFLLPLPGLSLANLEAGLQTSWQTSAGVEVDVTDATTASLQVFHNAFFKMTDVLATGSDEFDARTNGAAMGLELQLRRRFSKVIGGFASYTLSRSTRHVDGRTLPSYMDRTHVGNVALSIDMGRQWRAGTRLVAYSGQPKLTGKGDIGEGFSGQVRDESTGREPAFYRLDLRLEKRWRVGEHGFIAFVAEVMNATARKEVLYGNTLGPITIPSVGLEAGF